MDEYIVGVDGGTTKTVALVANAQGRILAATRGGNTNTTGSDIARPMSRVAETVRSALAAAGLTGDDVTLGMFCLAGADWPEDYERRAAALTEYGLAQRVVIRNDALGGWRAGCWPRATEPYGIVIAAGTGANACVLTPDGREWCYGYYASYGGAIDVARDAIRAVLRAEDGRGQPTALTGLILSRLGYPSPEALLKGLVAGELPAPRISPLCSLVFSAACAGDGVARDLIVHQGQALAEYATAAIRRYEMTGLTFDVVLAGGLFRGQGPLLVDTITATVARVAPRARIVRSTREPALGALLLAYDALGLAVTDELAAALDATAPGPAFFDTTRDEIT